MKNSRFSRVYMGDIRSSDRFGMKYKMGGYGGIQNLEVKVVVKVIKKVHWTFVKNDNIFGDQAFVSFRHKSMGLP